MKIAIAVNHSWPHIGGSETVTRQVAEGLVKKYGYECTIYSTTTTTSPFFAHGVKYKNCFNNHIQFLKDINGNYDRLLVYSDLFVHWPRLVHDITSVKCPVIMAPVGMNGSLRKSAVMSKMRACKDKLKFIVHTEGYHDQKILEDMNAEVYCIPNAVDLKEFDEYGHRDVTSHYGIHKDKINLLNVSNFFPDKGQELLPACLVGLEDKINVILISSGQSYALNKQLRQKAKRMFDSSGINAIFLEEIPRYDMVNFYRECDIFIFPSLIESFGIVPMEAMACRTPWVSFPVGNMKNFEGGLLVNNGFSVGLDGRIQPTQDAYLDFGKKVSQLIEDKELRKKLGEEGRIQVEQEYTLDVVVDKYKEVICG